MAAILEDLYSCPILNAMLSDVDTETEVPGLSGYNNDGTDIRVPGGMVNAMITLFLTDTIGIGVTDSGEIYTELKGNERDTVIGVLYHPKTKKVQACQFNVADTSTKQALINSSVSKTPFQVAIPFMVEQRIKDKFKELEGAWQMVLTESANSSMPRITNCEGTHYIIDSFVSAANNEFPIDMGNIENLALVPGEVFDYTGELLDGKTGTFYLTKGIPKPENEDPFSSGETRSFQKQMQDLKNEMFPLVKNYYEALSEEDKALVPNEEKLGIYIPTKKFINVVKILADGIQHGERDTQNILLKGPPGTGKSTMAVAIAYVFSMPYRFTQSYKTADASEYIGTTVADNGVLKTNIETQFAQTVLRGGVHMDDDNSATCSHTGL